MTNQLKAAVGKVLITPEEPVGLQGFNARVNIAHPPGDILDDIFARILVLDDGKRRSVIVSVDSCMSDEIEGRVPSGSGSGESVDIVATFPPGTRKSWAKAAGADENNAAVFATHTHAAPCHFSAKYTKRIEEKIAELSESLVPVKLSISENKSALTAFRRPTLHPNFNVDIDQTLSVILFETDDTKLLGAIVAYAMHPTILHPPTPVNRVSTECVGWAMNELEEEIGGGFISLFAQGFSGDVCPILPGCGADMDTDTYGNVRKAGHDLFQDIKQTIQQRTPIQAAHCVIKQISPSLPTVSGYYR
ncbi:MAG: neutral ceramidase, partial [Cohnella sp.]|nr:neutral ceramidase [Cohnella sp.]